MNFSVKVIGKTVPLVEGVNTISEFIQYQAKVSNPDGQLKKTKLLDYLRDRKEWSPFEMATIQVEVEAPRDISRQMLRHTSARFQEFSQRYAEVQNFCVREIRSQDYKNRQNSIDNFSEEDKREFENDCEEIIEHAKFLYDKWIKAGGAKECCRVFLPEGLTMSRLYMSAPIRTWMHYLELREEQGVTQKEHVMIANEIRNKLHEIEPELFPTVEALVG